MLKRSLSTFGTAVVFTSMWVGQAQAYSSAVSYSYLNQYQNSTALVKGEALRVAAGQTVGLIFGGCESGGNKVGKSMAGGAGDSMHVCVNAGWTNPENTGPSTKYTGDNFQTFVSMDYHMQPYTLGLAVGYEESNYSTPINGGKRSGNGYTVAPFITYQYNDMLGAKLAGGYSWLNYDLSRKALMPNQASNTTYENFILLGSPDADRYFGALELNARHQVHNWHVMGKANVLFAHESQDQFSDTRYTTGEGYGGFVNRKEKSRIGSLRVGADVSYPFDLFTPFVGADYVWDFSRSKAYVNTAHNGAAAPFGATNEGVVTATMGTLTAADNDSTAVELRAGVKYCYDNFHFNLVAATEQSRSEFDRNSVMATVSAGF